MTVSEVFFPYTTRPQAKLGIQC